MSQTAQEQKLRKRILFRSEQNLKVYQRKVVKPYNNTAGYTQYINSNVYLNKTLIEMITHNFDKKGRFILIFKFINIHAYADMSDFNLKVRQNNNR